MAPRATERIPGRRQDAEQQREEMKKADGCLRVETKRPRFCRGLGIWGEVLGEKWKMCLAVWHAF